MNNNNYDYRGKYIVRDIFLFLSLVALVAIFATITYVQFLQPNSTWGLLYILWIILILCWGTLVHEAYYKK